MLPRVVPLVVMPLVLTSCGSAPPPPVASTSAAPTESPSAKKKLEDGELRIEVAGGDCAAACEGLAMIVEARVALCSPRTSACADAERRDGEARKRVQSFCGNCPGIAP